MEVNSGGYLPRRSGSVNIYRYSPPLRRIIVNYWQLSGSLARSSQGSTELMEVNRTILYHVVELLLPGRHDKRLTCFRCFVRYHAWTARLTLSLPRVINVKFPLQPHQKYYITQYEELGFSYLTQMENDYTTKFSLPHLYTYTYT